MKVAGGKQKGLYRRKLGKDPLQISKLVTGIVKELPTVTEQSETGTTEFEPYVLSDSGSDTELKNGANSRNHTNNKRNSANRRRRNNDKMQQDRMAKSKKLYNRIAQCGDNVAINNIAKKDRLEKAPIAQVILKETYLQCPFVEGHHVPSRNFKKHVRACQERLAPRLKLLECPFNSNHLIPMVDYQDHVARCRDQAQYTADIANSQAHKAIALEAPMRRMQISGQVDSGPSTSVQARRRSAR